MPRKAKTENKNSDKKTKREPKKQKEIKQPEGERYPAEVPHEHYKQLTKVDLLEWKLYLSEINASKQAVDKYTTLLTVELEKNPKIKEYQTILQQANLKLQQNKAKYSKHAKSLAERYDVNIAKVAIDEETGVMTLPDEGNAESDGENRK